MTAIYRNLEENVARGFPRTKNTETQKAKYALLQHPNVQNRGDLEIVMNELQRFKHSADFLANSSHIIESAAIPAS